MATYPGDENVSSNYKDWSASCIAQFLIDVWPSKSEVDKLVGTKYGMFNVFFKC